MPRLQLFSVMIVLESFRVTKLGMSVIVDASDTLKKSYAYVFSLTVIVFHEGIIGDGFSVVKIGLDISLVESFLRNLQTKKIMQRIMNRKINFFIYLIHYYNLFVFVIPAKAGIQVENLDPRSTRRLSALRGAAGRGWHFSLCLYLLSVWSSARCRRIAILYQTKRLRSVSS